MDKKSYNGEYSAKELDKAFHECLSHHGLDYLCDFKFPNELTEPSTPQTGTLLRRLPNEILLEILKHSDNPFGRLCLALSCKRFLRVAMMLRGPHKITIPAALPHRNSMKSLFFFATGHEHCPALRGLLNLMRPVGADGKPAENTAVCHRCFRIRARDENYENYKREEWDKETWLDEEGKSVRLACPQCTRGIEWKQMRV